MDKNNNNDKSYKIITEGGSDEIEIKKSRFIGQAFPIENAKEAEDIIKSVEKKYWDARHNCYAYVLGALSENQRFSDNGEPSGTAGKPILEVIMGAGITNTLIVVTRYFGGTLLGTGGLVRAYTQASQAALAASKTAVMTYGQKISFSIGYDMVDKIQHTFGLMEIPLDNPTYGVDVSYDIIVSAADVDKVITTITEITSARATIIKGDTGFYPI
ncbi:MAG: YigZ family protein [Butyrivibrio sp.]|uniref:YigZ family protein n=1 Tax=Butyrivibrio sp. TaxID=28121 RepID=UPI0025FBC525|nr:YigZ family protein [Butyrivibrio sp.]MCR5772598.1 YigZ family protein [Butyrivibrio sp.]